MARLPRWEPEDPQFWKETGSTIAWRTCALTTFSLIFSFATWFVMSAVVVRMPAIGFKFTTMMADAAKCPHDAPKELCFICDPALREKGRLWCKEHDRYEDRCWICHPEAQDKNRLWCKEHSLYEDECFLCHPELKKKGA